MRKNKKKLLPLLLIGLLSLAGIIYLIIYTSPEENTKLLFLDLSNKFILFALALFSTFSLTAYVSKNTRRGIFATVFIFCLLSLYLYKLAHAYFILLLVALFILLEFLFKKDY